MPTVQYRVVVGKKDEIVDGPDDADVVVTVPLDEVRDADFDPTVAYMQRQAEGDRARPGALFDAAARPATSAAALSRLASQSLSSR